MEEKVNRTERMAELVQQVEPSESLMQRLHSIPKQVYDKVPKKVVWSVAASIAVLIVLNVFSLQEYNETETTTNKTQTEDSYFSYLNQL